MEKFIYKCDFFQSPWDCIYGFQFKPGFANELESFCTMMFFSKKNLKTIITN